jgi:hypothetical protein
VSDQTPHPKASAPPAFLDPKSVCYFQGTNGYGEALPERAAFKPFYAFTFATPGIGVEEFCQIRSWCNDVLGESDEGRWLEDFDFWHLGDPGSAEAFRITWIEPRMPKWGKPVISETTRES